METMTMKKWIVLACLILIFAGCTGQKEKENVPPKELAPAEMAKNVETGHETAPGAVVEQPLSVKVQENRGWYPILREGRDFERCFDFSGCIEGKKKYLLGVIKTADGIFCGESNQHTDYVEGYRCESKSGQVVCSQAQCKCGEEEILLNKTCPEIFEETEVGVNAEMASEEENEQEAAPDQKSNLRTCGTDFVVEDDGTYREFSCLDIFGEDTSGSDQGFWYCDKQNGCRTPDGRIYNPLSRIEPWSENSDEFCMYHLVGNEDTSSETLCETGDCVFPEGVDPNQRLAKIRAYTKWIPQGFSPVCEEKSADGQCGYQTETEYEVEGFVIDTQSCEGGVRYCHGKDNKPMKAPNVPEGYRCKVQYQVPGSPIYPQKSKNALRAWTCEVENCECGGQKCPQNAICMDEKCFCNDKPVDSALDYACDIDVVEENAEFPEVRVLQRCVGKNCSCGRGNCALNEACVEGQCVCRNMSKPSESAWRCEDTGNKYEKDAWRCNDPKGCVCGDETCPLNAQCIQGACMCHNDLDIKPGSDYVCEKKLWVCKSETSCPCYGGMVDSERTCYHPYCRRNQTLSSDGCMCGDKPALSNTDYECLKSEKFGLVNVANEDGVLCGATKCDEGMYCIQAKCVTPEMGDGEAAHIYWTNRVMAGSEMAVLCEKPEGCLCGAERCAVNYFCIDGHCAPSNYSFERDGHQFSFDLQKYGDDDDNEEAIIEASIFGRWRACGAMENLEIPKDDTRRFDEIFPIDYAHSDRYDDYTCIVKSTANEEDEDDWRYLPFEKQYVAEGLICSKDVCLCGEKQCSSSSECQCRYEQETQQIRCDCLARVCGDSDSGYRRGYACIPDLGLVCHEESCVCGSIQCPRGSVCLSDGVCTPSVIESVPHGAGFRGGFI